MIVIGGIALYLLNVVLFGFTLKVLWGWFAVPAFGLPALSIPTALGLSMIVSLLTKQYQKDERTFGAQMAYSIAECLIALAVGWIITLFM